MLQAKLLIPFLRNKITYLVSLLIFVSIFAGLYYFDSVYRIKTIKIISPNEDYILRGLDALHDKRTWNITQEEISNQITRNNVYVESVSILKQYPDTLVLTVEFKEPLAYLKIDQGALLLSENAIILEKQRKRESSKYPVISFYQSIPHAEYHIGEQLEFKEIKDALFFMKKLEEMRIRINSIDIEGFHMLGLYTDDEAYLFSSDRDREIQAYQLEASVREFRISGESYTELDLRFEKPVVTSQ